MALVCAMLFAPVAMAAGCGSLPTTEQATSHCAEADGNRHAPAKQAPCMGACSGVEVGIARFATRIASPVVIIPIPTVLPLGDVLPERDTPPPRLS